jgi:hypothetical protein
MFVELLVDFAACGGKINQQTKGNWSIVYSPLASKR